MFTVLQNNHVRNEGFPITDFGCLYILYSEIGLLSSIFHRSSPVTYLCIVKYTDHQAHGCTMDE